MVIVNDWLIKMMVQNCRTMILKEQTKNCSSSQYSLELSELEEVDFCIKFQSFNYSIKAS